MVEPIHLKKYAQVKLEEIFPKDRGDTFFGTKMTSPPTWRIIPVSKCLVTPIYRP